MLVVIAIVALLVGILLPALNAARNSARKAESTKNVATAQEGATLFAQSNDGYGPGLTNRGGDLPADLTQGFSSEGSAPMTRWLLLMTRDLILPETAVSPAEQTGVTLCDLDTLAATPLGLGDEGAHVSYSMLALGDASDDWARREAWTDAGSAQSVTFADRNTGANATGSASSLWTGLDDGTWVGSVVFADGAAKLLMGQVQEQLVYAGNLFEEDNLFAESDETGVAGTAAEGSSAGLVYDTIGANAGTGTAGEFVNQGRP
jgi:type II secretory pathway pseudopilin PulG